MWLVAIPPRGWVEHGEVSAGNGRDLPVDLVAATVQFGQAGIRVGLRAEDQLTKQVEDRVQP
jgi:hypothetical protein